MIANNKHFSAEGENLNKNIGLILELAHSEPTEYNNEKFKDAITHIIGSLDRINNMKHAEAEPARTGAGTHADPIRYEHVNADDPDRQEKRAAQRRQFTVDAKAGRVLCLSDLMISHGM